MFWILFAPLCLAAPSQPMAQVQTEENRDYRVSIRGIQNGSLKGLLEESSQLITLRKSPPPSASGLTRRIENDRERLNKVLRSEGYYAARLDIEIDGSQRPVSIFINIEQGRAFLIDRYTVDYIGAAAPAARSPRPLDQKDAGIALGTRLRSQRIIDGERQLIRTLQNSGYPFAEISDRTIRLDFATHTANVSTKIDHGGYRTFGALKIEGAGRVQEGYIRNFIPWKAGDPFDARKLSAYDQSLEGLELFEAVRIDYSREKDALAPDDGAVPLSLIAKERKHRSFALGVQYSTNEGAGGSIGWENRNLFGRGQRFSAEASGTQLRQGIDLAYRQPEFGRSDQTLILGTEFQRESSDAFDELSGQISAGIERRISRRLTLTAIVEAEFADLEDSFGSSQSQLIALPLLARWDSTDNLLDPSKGVRASGRLVPHIGANEGLLSFVSFDASGSTYKSFGRKKRVTIAGRVRTSVAVGETTADIPANRRFYSGGAGSIRGFDFRDVGPLDGFGDPVGGRSRFEMGLELRTKVTEDIGLVPFIEGGNVFDKSYPNFDGGLLWGAGLGLRYYTAIGPIRLDIATPLNPRTGVDGNIEFYISLGQAF